MRYRKKRGMRSGRAGNRGQLWRRSTSGCRAGTWRPNRRRFQMALRVRQGVVKHLLIVRRNGGGLRHLKWEISQERRQEQKCASMQNRGNRHLLSGEAARANRNVAKKFVRNQRQMNGIARQYGS